MFQNISRVPLLASILCAFALTACSERQLLDAPLGSEVPSLSESPWQRNIAVRTPIHHEQWKLIPVAEYALTGRVLGVEKYYRDALADLVPVDLALAWGPAANDEVQSKLKVWQSGRWFFWQTTGSETPLPKTALIKNMANVHIVVLDDRVRDFLSSIEPDQVVSLKGQLVNIEGPDKASSRITSLSRQDTGGGSCEIFLVQAGFIHPDS